MLYPTMSTNLLGEIEFGSSVAKAGILTFLVSCQRVRQVVRKYSILQAEPRLDMAEALSSSPPGNL